MSTAVADLFGEEALVVQMPRVNVLGPGRDRRFALPQYFLDLDGQRVAFADSGTPGPVVVFIHGLGGNITHWTDVAPQFVDRYRVICIDLYGHGESARLPGGYTVNGYVSQVLGLLDRLGIRTATIVGHSMGGMVTTALSLHAPERVRAAVLVNPAGMQPQPLPLRIGAYFVLRQKLLNKLLPLGWNRILSQVFYSDNYYTRQFAKTVEETYDDGDVYSISHLMESLRHDLLERDYAALLPQLERPVWLIWGDRDRLVPARFLRRAAKKLRNVVAEEISDCGHMPNIERPDRIIRFVDRALLGQLHG